MERDPRAVVRPVSKGRFRTLLSVTTNLANLNFGAAVMQQRASAWVDFISPAAISLYIYNKVYSRKMGVLSWRIYSRMSACGVSVCQYVRIHRESHAVVYIHRSAWADSNVAYPHQGAMLEPVVRDKHARDITPTSFLFPYV